MRQREYSEEDLHVRTLIAVVQRGWAIFLRPKLRLEGQLFLSGLT
jgi:hypothetical protein